jgi:hypothetical protein
LFRLPLLLKVNFLRGTSLPRVCSTSVRVSEDSVKARFTSYFGKLWVLAEMSVLRASTR